MQEHEHSYGTRLYTELRKLTGYALIASKFNYETIQCLKDADRDRTLKLFAGSDYAVLQQIKTQEPEEVAQFLAAEAERAAREGAAVAAMLAGMPFLV